MTKPQLQALHIFRRQLTTATHGHFDEDAFRLVLRNLGRVPAIGRRWREIDERGGSFLSTRQEWEIHRAHEQLVAAGVPYTLDSVIRQMSGGRTADPRGLTPHEAFKAIEMLHAVGKRQTTEIE